MTAPLLWLSPASKEKKIPLPRLRRRGVRDIKGLSLMIYQQGATPESLAKRICQAPFFDHFLGQKVYELAKQEEPEEAMLTLSLAYLVRMGAEEEIAADLRKATPEEFYQLARLLSEAGL